MNAPYRNAYSNFPRARMFERNAKHIDPVQRLTPQASFSLPRQIKSTVAPSPTSASTERRGLGSNWVRRICDHRHAPPGEPLAARVHAQVVQPAAESIGRLSIEPIIVGAYPKPLEAGSRANLQPDSALQPLDRSPRRSRIALISYVLLVQFSHGWRT